MRKSRTLLISFIITAIFEAGCSSSNVQDNNLEDIALKEGKKYQLNKSIL